MPRDANEFESETEQFEATAPGDWHARYWRTTARTWREALEKAFSDQQPVPADYKRCVWKDDYGFWFVGIHKTLRKKLPGLCVCGKCKFRLTYDCPGWYLV